VREQGWQTLRCKAPHHTPGSHTPRTCFRAAWRLHSTACAPAWAGLGAARALPVGCDAAAAAVTVARAAAGACAGPLPLVGLRWHLVKAR
jgi:hypothetical protein